MLFFGGGYCFVVGGCCFVVRVVLRNFSRKSPKVEWKNDKKMMVSFVPPTMFCLHLQSMTIYWYKRIILLFSFCEWRGEGWNKKKMTSFLSSISVLKEGEDRPENSFPIDIVFDKLTGISLSYLCFSFLFLFLFSFLLCLF